MENFLNLVNSYLWLSVKERFVVLVEGVTEINWWDVPPIPPCRHHCPQKSNWVKVNFIFIIYTARVSRELILLDPRLFNF